jgi:hypothetical protein
MLDFVISPEDFASKLVSISESSDDTATSTTTGNSLTSPDDILFPLNFFIFKLMYFHMKFMTVQYVSTVMYLGLESHLAF